MLKRDDPVTQLDSILNGDKKAISRALTKIEEGEEEILKSLYTYSHNARIIGITGVPGSGKSTLLSKLALPLLEAGKKVGILAIDPTSPFSGGALLGDRIRMGALNRYENVFVRSIATKGKLGGVSFKTLDFVTVLDAAGYDPIFIETVGTGQDEIDVYNLAHTTVVVVVPTLGDDIQTMKAGVMEIGDVYIVNKSDYEYADLKVEELRSIITPKKNGWTPPVLKTIALTGSGISEVLNAFDQHWSFLNEKGYVRRKEALRIKYEIKQHLNRELEDFISTDDLDLYVNEIAEKKLDPYRAAIDILKKLGESYGKRK